jgi:hypothetical protein
MVNIFRNLFNFSYKRNWWEAIVFYVVYLLLSIFLTIFLSSIQGIIDELFYITTPNIFMFVSPIFCLIISLMLLVRKGLFKNFGYLVLAVLSVVLILPPLSVIIPAFLTTRQSR